MFQPYIKENEKHTPKTVTLMGFRSSFKSVLSIVYGSMSLSLGT